ncbi:MAG: anion transporter, partial [Candidatus Krumholzibacteria bacterium]|nr:anion transporter [Candidatus Krumholzibacteria bacterium]
MQTGTVGSSVPGSGGENGSRTEKSYSSRNRCGLFLGPVLFVLFFLLPETFLGGEARRVAAVTVLMATWWICESIPLPATALIPL